MDLVSVPRFVLEKSLGGAVDYDRHFVPVGREMFTYVVRRCYNSSIVWPEHVWKDDYSHIMQPG